MDPVVNWLTASRYDAEQKNGEGLPDLETHVAALSRPGIRQ
jgi:hypothetical protein